MAGIASRRLCPEPTSEPNSERRGTVKGCAFRTLLRSPVAEVLRELRLIVSMHRIYHALGLKRTERGSSIHVDILEVLPCVASPPTISQHTSASENECNTSTDEK